MDCSMAGSSVLHYLPKFAFGLFILSFGFPTQEYWHGLPFPTPVGHVFSELFTMMMVLTLHLIMRSLPGRGERVAGAPTRAADLGCLRAAREPLRIRIRLPGILTSN